MEQAWQRNLTIFSSNYRQVKCGALFVLYADKVTLGKTLAKMPWQHFSAQVTPTKIQTLNDVRIAINGRMAHHIGLDIPSEQQRLYDFVFPQR